MSRLDDWMWELHHAEENQCSECGKPCDGDHCSTECFDASLL